MLRHPTHQSGISITPLYAVDLAAPLAHILQLDECKLLLDAGWTESFQEGDLDALKAVASSVDIVLLSHADLQHCGALPLLVASFGLTAAIYASVPTSRLGRLALQDVRSCRAAEGDFSAWPKGSIDMAFDRVEPLRWRQTIALTGKGAGISITPHAAGHDLGGSIWQISLHGEDYVYAVDMNHRKERLLNGATLEQLFSRPALLITDAFSVERPLAPRPVGRQRPLPPPNARGRSAGRHAGGAAQGKSTPQLVAAWECELMETLMQSLRANGRVLIAVDAAGRVLELALALEAAWASDRLPYPVVIVGATSAATLESASSQVEWMSDGLQRVFEAHHTNPFDLRHVRTVATLDELQAYAKGPAVVIAASASLAAGPSRHLLASWGRQHCNAIVFLAKPVEGTLAAQVVAAAAQRPKGAAAEIAFTLSRREALQGAELAEHEAAAAAAAVGGGAHDSETKQQTSQPSVPAGIEQPGSATSAKAASHAGGEVVLPSNSGQVSQSHTRSAASGGGGAWDVVIEGFTVPQGAVAPMFDDVNGIAALDISDYGASIESLGFQTEDAQGVAIGADLGAGKRDEPEEVSPSVIPTKIVVQEIRFQLQAQVLVLSAEGRSDERSHRTIIEHLAPRHLVITRGVPKAREALAGYCREELSSLHTAVHTPGQGELIQLSASQEAVSVPVAPSLVGDLKLQSVGKYQLSWVSLTAAAGASDKGVELEPVDPSAAGASSYQGGVFIGDVKLSDLKAALAAAGVPSEWEGPGALVIARGRVRVRLAGGARAEGTGTAVNSTSNLAGVEKDNAALLVEGALCKDYSIVRDLLYGQYHVC